MSGSTAVIRWAGPNVTRRRWTRRLPIVLRWRGLDEVPADWGRCVLTIGVFDGVHRGHAQLIARAVTAARKRGVPSVLMTFDPHPMEVVRPGSHPAQLTTLQRRAELAQDLGIDVFCVMPFTADFMKLTPERYVHEILVERLHVAEVVVGDNFTFGKKALGNVDLLREMGARFGFAVDGVQLLAEHAVTFSSTYIRSCVDAGDMEAATEALGRPHRVEGVVVHGDKRGRELGFPTANVAPPMFSAIPADGVYAAWFTVLGAGEELGTSFPVADTKPRCLWVPIRPSPAGPEPWRHTFSTPKQTCTDNTSRSTWFRGFAAWRSSTRSSRSSRR